MKDASHVKTNKQRSQFGSSKYKKTTFQKCSRKISIKQKKKRWLLDLGFFPPSETLEKCFPLRFGMESGREEVGS